MTTIAVIPARGGSKGVPRKNVRMLAGKPLIAWSIEAALAAPAISRVVVSTEDEEIADVACAFGAETPFVRPPELASDEASTLSVLQHAVRELERQPDAGIDRVVLLQPTSPLRNVADIEATLAVMGGNDVTSAISVVAVQHAHPMLLKTIRDGLLVPYMADYPEGARRQDLSPPVYAANGAVYVLSRDTLVREDALLGSRPAPYIMDAERSLDIDTEFDLHLADFLLRRRQDAEAR